VRRKVGSSARLTDAADVRDQRLQPAYLLERSEALKLIGLAPQVGQRWSVSLVARLAFIECAEPPPAAVHRRYRWLCDHRNPVQEAPLRP